MPIVAPAVFLGTRILKGCLCQVGICRLSAVESVPFRRSSAPPPTPNSAWFSFFLSREPKLKPVQPFKVPFAKGCDRRSRVWQRPKLESGTGPPSPNLLPPSHVSSEGPVWGMPSACCPHPSTVSSSHDHICLLAHRGREESAVVHGRLPARRVSTPPCIVSSGSALCLTPRGSPGISITLAPLLWYPSTPALAERLFVFLVATNSISSTPSSYFVKGNKSQGARPGKGGFLLSDSLLMTNGKIGLQKGKKKKQCIISGKLFVTCLCLTVFP